MSPDSIKNGSRTGWLPIVWGGLLCSAVALVTFVLGVLVVMSTDKTDVTAKSRAIASLEKELEQVQVAQDNLEELRQEIEKLEIELKKLDSTYGRCDPEDELRAFHAIAEAHGIHLRELTRPGPFETVLEIGAENGFSQWSSFYGDLDFRLPKTLMRKVTLSSEPWRFEVLIEMCVFSPRGP